MYTCSSLLIMVFLRYPKLHHQPEDKRPLKEKILNLEIIISTLLASIAVGPNSPSSHPTVKITFFFNFRAPSHESYPAMNPHDHHPGNDRFFFQKDYASSPTQPPLFQVLTCRILFGTTSILPQPHPGRSEDL